MLSLTTINGRPMNQSPSAVATDAAAPQDDGDVLHYQPTEAQLK